MASECSRKSGRIGWFLIGAAAGAAAALLTAPRTGHETRELLAEQGESVARRAHELAEGRGAHWLDDLRTLLEEQTQRLLAAFEAGREAMREEIARRSATRE